MDRLPETEKCHRKELRVIERISDGRFGVIPIVKTVRDTPAARFMFEHASCADALFGEDIRSQLRS